MSSAQPGSMPETNTELSPCAHARSTASVTGAGALGRVQQRIERRRHHVGARLRGTRRGRRTRRRVGCRRSRCTRRRRRSSTAYATLDVVGGEHAERFDERELAGVRADLGRVRHHHARPARGRRAPPPPGSPVALRCRSPTPPPGTSSRSYGAPPCCGIRSTVASGHGSGCYSGIFSHHWHHQSAPTRMRSFGCQQYEISAVFSR